MFTQENLTKIFKGKEFGNGKWLLYFHAKEYDSEESEVSINILDGIVEIADWTVNDDNERTTEIEGMAYIPFELINDIQFTKDF